MPALRTRVSGLSFGSDQTDDAVHFFEAELIAQAIVVARERPDVRLVALVGERDTPAAAYIRDSGEPYLRGLRGSAALLMDRQDAKDYLLRECPRMLDFLVDEKWEGRRQIPVIHASARGYRSEGIGYVVTESES